MLFNILILVGILIIFALWPKSKVSFDTSFEANHIGEDVEEYLRLNEGAEGRVSRGTHNNTNQRLSLSLLSCR